MHFESIRWQLNQKSCQGFHLTSNLTSDRLENGSRQREMWTLPLDTALKQQSPIMAYGLASRNSPTDTHTHTQSFLWHKQCVKQLLPSLLPATKDGKN